MKTLYFITRRPADRTPAESKVASNINAAHAQVGRFLRLSGDAGISVRVATVSWVPEEDNEENAEFDLPPWREK